MFDYFAHIKFMARTVYKSKMDSFLTTQVAQMDELEFPLLVSGCGDLTNFDSDDVFNDVLKGTGEGTELSAQDVLDELDFQNGSTLMDTTWMTEKVDFSYASGLSAEETISDLFSMSTIDIPLPCQMFETLEETFTTGEEVVSEEKNYSPTSPEQKVPDFVSPVSIASPSSVSSADSGVPSPSCQGVCATSSSPQHYQEKQLHNPTHRSKSHKTPYSRESPGARPKVKSPEQKERKRVQNKDAATRYRLKKRDEQGLFLTEVEGLEKDNTELKEQVASLSKEIQYLKNLILDVYKVKLQK